MVGGGPGPHRRSTGNLCGSLGCKPVRRRETDRRRCRRACDGGVVSRDTVVDMSGDVTSERSGRPEERGPAAQRVMSGARPGNMYEAGDGDDKDDVPTTFESVGDADIDTALQTLTELDDRPVQEHADALERVHQALQDRLAEGQE